MYVFNLIVGTGAQDAQDNQGSRVVTQPPVMSFVTVTFIIESISLATAVIKTKNNTTTPEKAD